MKIISTFIVWDKKNLVYVKLHQCMHLGEEKFFIERRDGKLQLIGIEEAKELVN
jgi:hypothetical protein